MIGDIEERTLKAARRVREQNEKVAVEKLKADREAEMFGPVAQRARAAKAFAKAEARRPPPFDLSKNALEGTRQLAEAAREAERSSSIEATGRNSACSVALYMDVLRGLNLGYDYVEIANLLEKHEGTISKAIKFINRTSLKTPEVKQAAVDAVKDILSNKGITTEDGVIRNNSLRLKTVAMVMPVEIVPLAKGPTININVDKKRDVNTAFEYKELKKY